MEIIKGGREQMERELVRAIFKPADNQERIAEVIRQLPLEETLAMLDADEPNQEQAKMLAVGMENLVGVLGNVCSGLGEPKH